MVKSISDIFGSEIVKSINKNQDNVDFIINSIKKITNIDLFKKEINIKNNQEVVIKTSGVKRVVMVLHQESIKKEILEKGFILKL